MWSRIDTKNWSWGKHTGFLQCWIEHLNNWIHVRFWRVRPWNICTNKIHSNFVETPSFAKNNLVFLRRPFCVLLLSRFLFWASGIAKISTKFIWGRLCVKVKVVPFLFQAFRFNFANYKTHASIFIGISKQMKSSPFSSWSFHLGLKTWFWWVSWPLTTFDNMFDITPCWPSCADLLFMVNMGKRSVWW